ncbi:hypothetical protein CABS03_08371 [Colletotrichum abscissum]
MVTGILSPISEISAGGNYNTRFLSPRARRALSPISESVKIPNWGNYSLPPHAIIPYVPLSLYLPRAGFLWQDDEVWLPEQGNFGAEWQLNQEEAWAEFHDLEQVGSGYSVETLYRAYFSDPIGRRHPWAFEQDIAADVFESKEEDYIRSHLWSGEIVHLRSRVTQHYMGVVGDASSYIDEEMNVRSEDGFRRLRVGGLKTKSRNTTWIIQYNSGVDNGFRLLNPIQDCYLSSSFRQFPNWDGLHSNDTVSLQLHGIIEATCTRGASKDASTFFIIEGTSKAPTRSWRAVCGQIPGVQRVIDAFSMGFHVAMGLLSLQRTRRLYGQTLDIPPALLRNELSAVPLFQTLEKALVATFLFSHAVLLLKKRRWPAQTADNVTQGSLSGRRQSHLSKLTSCAIFVWGHFMAYYVGNIARPSGATLVMIFSVVGLSEIVVVF